MQDYYKFPLRLTSQMFHLSVWLTQSEEVHFAEALPRKLTE
jgi:hypothetical protein